jgi:hypothetical protein
MSMENIIGKRGITEILHFTTNKGITGILATGKLFARSHLASTDYLEYIYDYNCEDRSRDQDWWSYVNLSMTSVNRRLFGISRGKWHISENGWWCILAFNPIICTHSGVFFTNTNNMYTSVKRLKGVEGLEAMFQPTIQQWAGKTIQRDSSCPDNQPTCQQAELLYPNYVDLDYLTKVYVENDEIAAKFDSIKYLFKKWKKIPCEVNNALFL